MKHDSSAIVHEEPSACEHDPPTLSWCAHPAREQPGRAFVGVVWIVAIAVVLYATTHNIFWPVFAVIFLLGVLNRFFFPTRFTIDDDGLTAASLLRTQRMRWSEVKRFPHDEQGGMLSDCPHPSRLDAYRGLHIIFGSDGKRAAGLIEEKIGQTKSQDGNSADESGRDRARASASGGDA